MGTVAVRPEPGSDAAVPASPRGSARRPLGRLDETRCSVQALVRGDSSVATAPPTARWVLVEQPGPWGRDALLQSRFDRQVAPLLARRARVEGVRLLLVRRPGDRRTTSALRWGYADGTPGRERLSWSVRASDAELLQVPWDGTAGEPAPGPVFLVCTHGTHDACCALRGRPLARALPEAGAESVWECSHLGGDRFAANAVVLPHGFYYGQVPGDGAELVRAHARGEVALPWLRGRAGVPAPAQAAQHAARERLGLPGVDDLPVLAVSRLAAPDGAERWQVRLRGPAGPVEVRLESHSSAEAALLTCRATHPAHARTWRVESVRVESVSTP